MGNLAIDDLVVFVAFGFLAPGSQFISKEDIEDSMVFQLSFEMFPVELRGVFAIWIGSNIRDGLDVIFFQKRQKPIEIIIRMADGIEDWLWLLLRHGK